MDKPIVGAFPGFLQDFANPVFVFFQTTDDGQIIAGGVTYRDLVFSFRIMLSDTLSEFVIQRFQRRWVRLWFWQLTLRCA